MRTLAISHHLDLAEARRELTGLPESPGPHCGQRHTPRLYPHITLVQWSRKVTETAVMVTAGQEGLETEPAQESRERQCRGIRGLFFP